MESRKPDNQIPRSLICLVQLATLIRVQCTTAQNGNRSGPPDPRAVGQHNRGGSLRDRGERDFWPGTHVLLWWLI
jgi:hypothetical protein